MAETVQDEVAGNLQESGDAGTRTCFIIMPFGEWFDQYHDEIYRPAIEEAGLHPVRADDLSKSGDIIGDIWQQTQEAEIVLADLTGYNPNVLYELGLAQATRRPTVLIMESAEPVPFDIRTQRTILFDRMDPGWGEKLKRKITESLRETLEAPLRAVLPLFLNAAESGPSEEVSPIEKRLLELEREVKVIRDQLEARGGIRAYVAPFTGRPEGTYTMTSAGTVPATGAMGPPSPNEAWREARALSHPDSGEVYELRDQED